jgi:hypothetical protein
MLILDSSTTLVGVDACRKTDLGRSDFSRHWTFLSLGPCSPQVLSIPRGAAFWQLLTTFQACYLVVAYLGEAESQMLLHGFDPHIHWESDAQYETIQKVVSNRRES